MLKWLWRLRIFHHLKMLEYFELLLTHTHTQIDYLVVFIFCVDLDLGEFGGSSAIHISNKFIIDLFAQCSFIFYKIVLKINCENLSSNNIPYNG